MASGAIRKTTTGLTGLAVAKEPHKETVSLSTEQNIWREIENSIVKEHTLTILYEKILRVVHKMPESAAYRKYTEAITQERLAHVKSESNVEKLEKKINCGQVEEVIIQAENELSLARKMLEWRPWEPLVGQAPPNQWKWPPVS